MKNIEEHIRSFANASSAQSNCRESAPFLYIRNLPRHGKSLALDMLFKDTQDVIVIPISYNSSLGIVFHECNDLQTAITGFWTRVMMGLLPINTDTDTLSYNAQNYPVTSWNSITTVSPELKTVNVVICIDEISKLICNFASKLDANERRKQLHEFWTSVAEFHNSRADVTGLCKAVFRRTVMTGFDHTPELSFVGSAFQVITDAIPIAKPRETLRLGQHLLWVYAKLGMPFPTFLFEIVKSSPGLLGSWAYVVLEPNTELKVRCFDSFCNNTSVQSWYKELIYTNLPTRVDLIEKIFYEETCDSDIRTAIDLGLGIKAGAKIELIPFVVVVIVNYIVNNHPQNITPLFSTLDKIIRICRSHCQGEPSNWAEKVLSNFDENEWSTVFMAKPVPKYATRNKHCKVGNQSEGACFEEFCLNAIALSSLIKTSKGKKVHVESLFGNTVFKNPANNIPVFVVNETQGLKNMLTEFCYSILPSRQELLDVGGLRTGIRLYYN